MPQLLFDLRLAFRGLRKAPGFTTVAVLTLALGIGANSAIFSLVNAVLLRPLPYDQPDQLALVWESAPFFGLRDSPVAPANYTDWRARSSTFAEMGALEDGQLRLTRSGQPEVVPVSGVTAGIFRALRTRPALGRIFRDDEDRPGGPRVVIASDAFWRRKLNSNPSAIGSTLILDNEKYTLVGVLAPGTEPPAEYHRTLSELWVPLATHYTAEELANRGRHNWMVIGRLRSGVSLAQANAELRTIGEALSRQYPDTNEKVGAFVAPLREHFVGSNRKLMLLLLGTVVFVLLIACSNLANLLLARSAQRAKEFAVRAALGAGAGRLVRFTLCESLLLCLAGALGGLLLASFAGPFLAQLAPATLTGLKDVAVDTRVAAFTLLIACSTTVLFGLLPLIELRRLDLTHSLKQGSRSLAGSLAARRLRALLAGAEVGLAFVLLIGAGLLLRTLYHVRNVDPGFDTSHLLTLSLPPARQPDDLDKAVVRQRELLARVRALPGVVNAGLTNHIPIAEKGDVSGVGAEGRDPKERFQTNVRAISPGYFETLKMRLTQGRAIEDRDLPAAPKVVVINQTLANLIYPGLNPIGRQIYFSTEVHSEIVGVVADIHQEKLDGAPKPELYAAAAQVGRYVDGLAIRTHGDPAALEPALRQTIFDFDPEQPVHRLATMDEVLDKEVAPRLRSGALLGAFALLALLLASVGLFGVLSYLVGQRIPEFGLRVALGATPKDLLRGIAGQALSLTGAGIAGGALAAAALTRWLSSFLYGVKPADPLTWAAVAVLLASVAVLASLVPARRAMGVDPITALREE